MTSVFIVYKTDSWHSYASRDLLGASEDLAGAIALVKKQVKKENQKLSDDDKHNLAHIKQTQGYDGEGEFDIEEVTLNKLL